MYFERDGRVSTAHEICRTVTLRPDISAADGRNEPCLLLDDVVHQIQRAAAAVAEDWVTPDHILDRIVVVRVIAEYPPGGAIEKLVRIPLSYDGVKDLLGNTWADPDHSALRGHAFACAASACRQHGVSDFIDEAAMIARCLNVLRYWGGEDVHEIVATLETLEWLAARYGQRLDDFYELHLRPTPMPEGIIWPQELERKDVWFWDRSGRTLVIDERGRLVEGPTLAERLGCRPLHRSAEASWARDDERKQVSEDLIARIRGDEEREAEPEFEEPEIPF